MQRRQDWGVHMAGATAVRKFVIIRPINFNHALVPKSFVSHFIAYVPFLLCQHVQHHSSISTYGTIASTIGRIVKR